MRVVFFLLYVGVIYLGGFLRHLGEQWHHHTLFHLGEFLVITSLCSLGLVAVILAIMMLHKSFWRQHLQKVGHVSVAGEHAHISLSREEAIEREESCR